MYNLLKKGLKSLFPGGFLQRNERLLRIPLRLYYYGRRCRCNLCGAHLRTFVELPAGDLLCPACGSLPRHRRLWTWLQETGFLEGRLLHFSPARPLEPHLRRLPSLDYLTTDYDLSANTDRHYDITAVPEPDDSFDRILCYHVLEHIPDDRRAMAELYRLLRPGGRLLVQTPFRPGEIYENPSVQTPAERLVHFGQEDHVRVYSVEGLTRRLREAGFRGEVLHWQAEPQRPDPGYKEEEWALLGVKS